MTGDDVSPQQYREAGARAHQRLLASAEVKSLPERSGHGITCFVDKGGIAKGSGNRRIPLEDESHAPHLLRAPSIVLIADEDDIRPSSAKYPFKICDVTERLRLSLDHHRTRR